MSLFHRLLRFVLPWCRFTVLRALHDHDMRSEYRCDCRSNLVDVECGNVSAYLRIVISQAGRESRPTLPGPSEIFIIAV